MSDILDENVSKSVAKIIYELTNKNFKMINDNALQNLLCICGDSDTYSERVYHLLADYLKKPHAEIRYNAFYILNTFFRKYSHFRQLVVEDLKYILDLTTNINYNINLPPPKNVANELNRFSLKSIKEWMELFGFSYKKLNLCYEFLLRKKNVNFEKLNIEDRVSKLRKQEEEEKKKKMNAKKLKLIKNEMEELKPEIENMTKSLESCLDILIPRPENFFINDFIEEYKTGEQYDIPNGEYLNSEINENAIAFREVGILKGNFSINISLPEKKTYIKIKETDENSVIIENAKDYYKLLRKKYLDIVKNWVKNLIMLSDPEELKQAIMMKSNIENLMKKYDNLIFEKEKILLKKQDISDSDSDLEEVIQDSVNVDEEIIANLIGITSETSSDVVSNYNNDDCIENGTENKQINNRKKKLLEIAPKLPFDVDLYHWEDENLQTPVLLPVTAEGRQFWSVSSLEDTDGIPIPEGAASLRTRIIEYTGKFEPVKWRCRFPLSNGKLCPRQDRYKCPFHGVIIPRDELGNCINPQNAKKDEELKLKINYSEAQNPVLLAEIKSATGIDLKFPERKKRKKTDECSLTNIKKEQNTVYRRLEKKLFKKSTVKKVAQTLDKLDGKRFRDKFGDQFQYVHETV